MRRRAMRRALYGWMFYAPAVLLVVGVLAFDAWLNIETRRNDYEVAELKAKAIQLNDSLEKLRSRSASNQQLEKLHERALELGLREPQPWQIERINMETPLKPASEFTVARVIPEPPALPERPTITLEPEPRPDPVQPGPEVLMAEASAYTEEEVLMEEMTAAGAMEKVAQLTSAAAEDSAVEQAPVVFDKVHSTSPVPLEIPDDAAEMLDESPESMLAI